MIRKAGTEVLMWLSDQFLELVSVFKEASRKTFYLFFSLTRQSKDLKTIDECSQSTDLILQTIKKTFISCSSPCKVFVQPFERNAKCLSTKDICKRILKKKLKYESVIVFIPSSSERSRHWKTPSQRSLGGRQEPSPHRQPPFRHPEGQFLVPDCGVELVFWRRFVVPARQPM
jgi:hypothetical protein